MPYSLTKLKTLSLPGTSNEHDFDAGTYAPSRSVYVARARNGVVKLRAYAMHDDGTFVAEGSERTVGNGSRTRIVVFSNQRMVVLWLDPSGTLRVRAYRGGSNGQLFEGEESEQVETLIDHFELANVGVTKGAGPGNPDGFVYYAYRHFAFTTRSTSGSWKLWLGTVDDSLNVYLTQSALGGPGDKVGLTCTPVNELVNGTHPRKVLTICRDSGQIKSRVWRVSGSGIGALGNSAETKSLGIASIHGMSIATNQDIFASLVWPGASNDTGRLQLLSVSQTGTMSVYGTLEIAQSRLMFARLRHYGSHVAVAYKHTGGKLAVAGWRLRQPGGTGSVRTVLASSVGEELPTEIRLATLIGDTDNDPVDFVTLIRVASGTLMLGSWRFQSALVPLSKKQRKLVSGTTMSRDG